MRARYRNQAALVRREEVRAGALPRYCTWTTSIPAITLNNSPARWLEVPAPGDSTLILPGLALAYAISSGIVLTGSDGCTVTTLGTRRMLATGAMSRRKS